MPERIGLGAEGQAASAACVLTPQKTEGPWSAGGAGPLRHPDRSRSPRVHGRHEGLNRSDIRTDPGDGSTRAGVPLALALVVGGADGREDRPVGPPSAGRRILRATLDLDEPAVNAR